MSLTLLGAGPETGVFTPLSISGLQAWWDPTTLAGTTNGASITSWTDSSGNGNTASGVLAKPTYSTSGINSHPAVAFSGSQCFEIARALVLLKPFTFACVVSVTNFTSTRRLLDCDQAGSIDLYTNTTTGVVKLDKRSQAGIATSSSGPTAGTGATLIVTYDGSGNWAMYLDGSSIGSGTTNTTFSAAAGTGLIGASDQAGTGGLVGLLGDALLTNTAISAGDRASLQAYLKAKWGTP